ncbi:uncharacterized protein LOC101855751 [Aplysia californica]|uniref:Uncharacterized protein LOC101855751 n=1 Tax=Aplysia californica TaxID=6500 RepID=A0ABM1A9W4_APLCA|nr:uncharacterized protein LOC101855751 [Aplysia californica]XP_012943624.1 uncharacterized protein LOC101855751 [Aplysia californica]
MADQCPQNSSRRSKSKCGTEGSTPSGVVKRSARIQKSVTKFSEVKEWTVVEKTKLLEAVRRFSPDNVEVLSSIVGTKTPEEIADYIKTLSKMKPSSRRTYQKTKDDDKEKSPMELWTELVNELVHYEPTDLGRCVTKVFGLITHNEEFAPSEQPRLSWRRIYQFLSDVLEDKAELQELSDVESHVVLDMMHGVGDTLHSSDTRVHQRLLTTKYKFLNTKLTELSEPARRRRYSLVHRGLHNDFDYLEEPSEVSDPTEPPTSCQENDDVTDVSAAAIGNTECSPAGYVTSTSVSTCASAETSSSSAQQSALTSSSPPAPTPGHSGHREESPPLTAESPSLAPGVATGDCRDASSSSSANHSSCGVSTTTKEFVKSKLFTLNPLCIPTSLLPLKPNIDSV